MELQQHLFNRREVIALVLDLDDTTIGCNDLALPPPPSLSRNGSATNTSGIAGTAASYTPPQTRLEVIREAFVAFVRAKVRSAPNSSSMTFGLYAVRGEGAAEEDVVEVVAPTSSGTAGGQAVQTALGALRGDAYKYGQPAASIGQSNGSSTEAYTGVARLLHRLHAEATARLSQSQPQPPHQSSASTSKSLTSMNGPSLLVKGSASASIDATPAGSKGKRSSLDAGAGSACVVVHGIVVRSRSTPPLMLPSTLRTTASTEAAEVREADVPLWLDVLALEGGVADSGRALVDAPQSAECFWQGCRCALLDPVELTGIEHRGLALGPALVRLMAIPQARTSAFFKRLPLSFLKILRGNAVSSSSDAAVASASSAKSTLSSTPNTSEKVELHSDAPAPSPRGCQARRPSDGARESDRANVQAATPTLSHRSPPTVNGARGASWHSTTQHENLPALSTKLLPPPQAGTGRTTLLRLPSSCGPQSCGSDAAIEIRRPPPPAATLPAMAPRISSKAACQQNATFLPRRVTETNASCGATGTADLIEGGKGGREWAEAAASAAVHRYATSSPDTVDIHMNWDDTVGEQRAPAGGATALVSAPKRAVAGGPTPSVGGRSPENSLSTRRPPSSIASTKQAIKFTPMAATTQAPLSTAAVRQQQDQQQQQQQHCAASAEHTPPPNTLFNPQPPVNDQTRTSPPTRRISDDAANPRHGFGARSSAGIRRSSPPPIGAAGRRVSAGAQMQHSPPSAAGETGTVRRPPPPSSLASRGRVAADAQNRTV